MTDSEKLTDKEIDARREAGLKKLLATPPKPHKPLKAATKSTKAKPA
ncbi:MAG: hypothetical protein HY834_17240 [Devosia nanyangense]|uniref:Uncharacterized protein n=1 Tax=Devosia nanyangense TaxID=1228055 RepID=A0A933L6X3_9HYPH|nr:hypothetical protein [Devosia nanyangense]